MNQDPLGTISHWVIGEDCTLIDKSPSEAYEFSCQATHAELRRWHCRPQFHCLPLYEAKGLILPRCLGSGQGWRTDKHTPCLTHGLVAGSLIWVQDDMGQRALVPLVGDACWWAVLTAHSTCCGNLHVHYISKSIH